MNQQHNAVLNFKLRPLSLAIRVLMTSGLAIANTYAKDPVLPEALNSSALATSGAAAYTQSGHLGTIKQTTDKAILEWKSFNIGSGDKVVFDQPNATSVALNNIHQSDPSQIMGSLKANGQIYLVNQNGFVFGKDSQVNVNSFVASTLGISRDVFERGLTKVFNIDNSAALQGNGEVYLKNDQGDFLLDQTGQKIKIQIMLESGADIKTDKGGRVIIAAPVIENQGSITTPDGQTILAAAKDKVYLQEAGSDSNLRGLLVEVETGGAVTNVGKVLAEQGNASLIGFAVNQKGKVSATTSVNLNGTVRLMAREGIQNPTSTGGKLLGKSTLRGSDLDDGLGKTANVTLDTASSTSVDLDTDKTTTAIDAQAQLKSAIEISGHDIVIKDQATVTAHSGNISVAAVDNPGDPKFKGNARIYLDSGSKIDASGVKNVSLPMERNVIEVELRKNELRDAPQQRDGVLYGEKVKVDIRDAQLSYDAVTGSLLTAKIPVADIKGAVDRIARNIDERSTDGGNINLSTSGSVVSQTGSVLDFSGGSVAYRDGVIATTQLMSQGQVVDIAKADPNQHYDSIVGSLTLPADKWGVKQSWQIPGLQSAHSESAYVDGKAGGHLVIQAYESALAGTFDGQTISGTRQRLPALQAAASSLYFDMTQGNLFGKQNVVFSQEKANIPSIDVAINRQAPNSKQVAPLVLDPASFKNAGIGRLSIRTNGTVTLQDGQTLALADNAQLRIEAAGVDIQGGIVTHGGSVQVQPVQSAGVLAANPINMGTNASIDVSGVWLNDWLSSQQGKPLSGLAAINGGSVSFLTERGDLTLQTGSHIDASSGAWLKTQGKLVAGTAGAISLTAATQTGSGVVSKLVLDGDVSAWGLTKGGSLNLVSNQVLIDSAVTTSSDGQQLLLSPQFFQRGGFSDYKVTANAGSLKVAENTLIQPRQANRQLLSDAKNYQSGSPLSAISESTTLAESDRQATSVLFRAQGLQAQQRNAVLSIGQNASIQSDPGASIALESDTSILIDGRVIAPAGTVNVTINTPTNGDTGFYASQGIWLGSTGQLSTNGVFVPQTNSLSLNQGEVLPGGNINLTANRGYIVTAPDSTINASGIVHAVDFIQTGVNQSQVTTQSIASPGGNINLTAAEGIIAQGRINTQGGDSAAGGKLAVELNSGLRNKPDIAVAGGEFPDDDNPAKPRTLEISQYPGSLLTDFSPWLSPIPAQFNGRGSFNAVQLNASGAAELAFKVDATAANQFVGSIVFDGDQTLHAQRSIVLDAPSLKTLNGANVILNSNYAVLGSSKSRLDNALGDGQFSTRLAPDAWSGQGTLKVNANAIDLTGGLSFNGFNQVDLNSQGDVRTIGIRQIRDTKDFLGELHLSGNLNITATQIYPTTLSDYTITINGNSNNAVTFLRNSSAISPVLSAAGQLTVNAPNIVQQGVLKAPFGQLSLNAQNNLSLASGSLTSVSSDGQTIPFGQVSGGLNWLYPLDASATINLLINTPPEKRLTLTGRDVALNQGAVVDLQGGGDLYAYEFVPGPGGSKDVLDATSAGYQPKFAVMPALANALTPIDPLEFPNAKLKVGDSVYLAAGSDLSAGWYTLLPAHYALLPGAYLVTPQAGSLDMQPEQSYTDYTGAAVVAGRYGVASAGIADSRWQGFTVEPGTIARSQSQFKDYSANTFFANNLASQLPKDAGGLSIDVINTLGLHAELRSAAANDGRGGQVNISADQLAIVGRREELTVNTGSKVVLLADDLNALNAPSILLGGLREQDKRGQRITVSAQSIHISGTAKLQGPEILLAAQSQIQLDSGAQLISQGNTGAAAENLLVSNKSGGSDGAFVRLSDNKQQTVLRDQAVSGNQGELLVASGVRLAAEGSMLLESTQNTVFAGDIAMNSGSLALKSSRISLGDAPTGTQGLVLHNTAFNLDELLLTSNTDLDIYGGVKLDTKQLTINAAQINGFNNPDDVATIKANRVLLTNTQASADQSGTGNGHLIIDANDVVLGAGQYAIDGFKQVDIQASQAIKGAGQFFQEDSGDSQLADPSILKVDANLRLAAGHFTGDNGATTTIDSGENSLVLATLSTPKALSDIGLGTAFTLNAGAITGNAIFDLPAGQLKLNSVGDIDLKSGTRIDLSGRDILMSGQHNYASAGELSLLSGHGNVSLQKDTVVKLSGADSHNQSLSNAGLLDVQAAEGLFNWNGSIEAWAANTAKTGRLNLAIGALATDSLTALNQKRLDAGFNEAFALSLNQGDLNLDKSDSIKANSLDLKALNGRVNIAGLLQSPNPEGGSIAVYGANGISLDATGTIRAADGHVFLDTVHRSDAGSGVLDLSNPGGTIDVSGSLGSGQIHLRAGRDANGNLASTAIQSKLIGAQAQNTVFEMTRVYEGVRAIDSNAISTWQTDTQQFMSAFKAPNSANLQWQPGIEIRSPDNLSLNNTWDFINWRYPTQDGKQTVPGYLTLRAPGKLSIQASITDALASDSLPGDSRIYKDMIQSGQSWNYTLVAGDNIELAPNYNNSGLNQVVVRTGTGSINLDSGHDIRFIADSRNPGSAAAIYTVGTVAAYTRNQLLQGLIPGLPQRLALETDAHYLNRLDPNVLNDLLRFGYLDDTRIGSLFQKAEFPMHGGDISLQAAGNINGIKTGQKISDWLVRSGTLTENNRATLWGINISGDRNNPSVKGIRNFNQNLGTLGGGNITVAAGGTVSNLSAMLPTTGKPFGTVSSTPNQWLENDVIVNGGGNLKISAGQNLVGGEYYVGKGQASLDVGGSIGQSSNSTFELGDAVIDVQARQNINIAGVYNPTVLKQAQIVGGDARFFSYDANSAINFLSVAGNITLNNNAGDGFEYSVYPSTLNVKALSGDISIDKSMTLFPDAKGQLNLLANNNIRSAAQAGQSVIINMSDADPSLLPLKNNAAPNLEGSLYDGLIRARERLDPGTPIASVIHAEKPIHLQDTQPVSIVANQGNIAFASGSNVSFVLPKSALFQAGNDIRNMSFDVQNLTENDTTRVLAGRDIVFDTQISNNGVVLANDSVFKLGGSGRLQVLAGQNINLGSAAGVETIGNILNTALGNGASIDVLNGLNGTLDIAGFVTKYAKNSDYQALLDSFVGKTFNDNDNAKVLPVVLKVLFKEIQAAATAAAAAPENKRGAMYQRGFDAIKTLLPDASYKGDLSLVFSQIKTLDSGDINILVPGGKVDVGLAGRQGGISKSADALGIVVQQQGNLSALANGNFNVNQSRVFTLAGGDLTVWSSKGSIDAGKGAKSAIAAPPPQTVVDEKGNIVTIFPPIVSGSGIQAVGNGLVTLAAPEGIVDAQEAGISGGQIVIAATAVVGASNISASGGTIGVPSSAPPVVNVSGADSAAANAAKSASQMTDGGLDRSDAKNTNKSAGQISVINADVIGFGDCSEADVRDGKPGCGG